MAAKMLSKWYQAAERRSVTPAEIDYYVGRHPKAEVTAQAERASGPKRGGRQGNASSRHVAVACVVSSV
eukprot:scaffold137212_cov24-Tisochrysis_lutea.AAC.1